MPEVVAIVGPTASGKTAIAQSLAEILPRSGEIISADSMQIYRGMNIGTAKPSPAERTVPYHCIDLVDPGEPYSAALFQRAAREAIARTLSAGHTPIVAGGTGLYVRAALDDWEFPTGEQGAPVRVDLEQEAASAGAHAMHERLRSLDPASAALIHPNNLRRTIRALEMAAAGDSYEDQASGFSKRRSVYDTVFIGLHVQREALYERIELRVDAMMAGGLLDEVRTLLEAGLREGLTAPYAIGYKELVQVVEGVSDLTVAVDQIKQATRRYAKRQMTWLRGDPRIRWIDVTESSPEDSIATIVDLVESHSPR
ncbi:MAG: tRNA (adenosine(37)-N6)-dimethylallyltransferase MiaA [Clostridiales bacterium]|nr:tRNA (adenosine(37)-N6)-dimethylallyltransferase MiaA [Clostridiales bacterium]